MVKHRDLSTMTTANVDGCMCAHLLGNLGLLALLLELSIDSLLLRLDELGLEYCRNVSPW